MRSLGLVALPDLLLAAEPSGNISVQAVCLGLIVELFESDDAQTHHDAKEALTRLANSKSKLTSLAAKIVLFKPAEELVSRTHHRGT